MRKVRNCAAYCTEEITEKNLMVPVWLFLFEMYDSQRIPNYAPDVQRTLAEFFDSCFNGCVTFVPKFLFQSVGSCRVYDGWVSFAKVFPVCGAHSDTFNRL